MKTYSVKAKDIQKKWLVVDASGQTLGRLASKIAHVLKGKHKPTFVPNQDCGDHVVVINASGIKMTGNKAAQKFYYRHSNYIGGIKAVSAEELLEKHPERVLEHAVKGMLPGSKLGRQMFKNLRIYASSEHPHAAQKPEPFPDGFTLGKGQ